MTAAAALAIDDLHAGYLAEADVLRGVTVEVGDGEIVTIVGPNGAGKSTLVKAVVGVLRVRSGRVLLRGDDITGLAGHHVARRGVGYVPQRSNVFPSLTVRENLDLGALPASGATADARDAIAELFPVLERRARQPAGSLSGGERQMLAMARALMASPSVLILDEPSAGLAPVLVDSVLDRIVEINDRGVTVLMVEQNARAALEISDRGYVLDLGTNRFEGTGADLVDDPKVAELYLGGHRAQGA